MKQGLSLRVSQHLALTPQLQQSIRLLQLSTLELSQEIEQMLDENPFLDKDFEEAPREEFGIDKADTPVRDEDISHEAEADSLREMPSLDGGMSEITVDNTASDTEPSVDGIAESWEGMVASTFHQTIPNGAVMPLLAKTTTHPMKWPTPPNSHVAKNR
jgi:RNA polymerase sigma-54 factor